MKNFKLVAAVCMVVAIGAGLWVWWHYGALHPATEDAFLRAHVVSVEPQVAGQVASVEVGENDQVGKGQVLFRIDPARYQNAVDAATAQVGMALDALNASAGQITAASQAVRSAQTTLDTATRELDRTNSLFAKGNIAQTTLDQQQATVAQTKAALDAARSQLTQAQGAQQTNRDSLAAAKAELATAKLDLDHTVVKSPVAGWVSNLDLRTGATVTAYEPLFAIVDDTHWWVEANFKETDLARIRPGQPVTISADILPGVTLKGHVSSVGFGSGSTFSLLLAENSSGNWVKVTQRFPVRIALDPTQETLRTGASVTARVDTTAGSGDTEQAAK